MVLESSTEEGYRFKNFSIFPYFPLPLSFPSPRFFPLNHPLDFITDRCNRKHRKMRVRRIYPLQGDKITTMALSSNNTTLFGIIIVTVLHRLDRKIRFYFFRYEDERKYHRSKYVQCRLNVR